MTSKGISASLQARSFDKQLRPMLSTSADALPAGPEWSYEVKWDGYRALAEKKGSTVRLLSRNDKDLTRYCARVRSPRCWEGRLDSGFDKVPVQLLTPLAGSNCSSLISITSSNSAGSHTATSLTPSGRRGWPFDTERAATQGTSISAGSENSPVLSFLLARTLNPTH